MYTPEYKTLVYEKAIIEQEINFLLETYIHGENLAPQELVNDYLFAVDRITPQEALQARVIKLRQELERLDNKLSRFVFRKEEEEHDDLPRPRYPRSTTPRRPSPPGGDPPDR